MENSWSVARHNFHLTIMTQAEEDAAGIVQGAVILGPELLVYPAQLAHFLSAAAFTNTDQAEDAPVSLKFGQTRVVDLSDLEYPVFFLKYSLGNHPTHCSPQGMI